MESSYLQTLTDIFRLSTRHRLDAFDQLIETLHEQEVSDLLDGGERVTDAARPEFLP